MRWRLLPLLILAAGLLMPQGSWAQTYDSTSRSVGRSVNATLNRSLDRQGATTEQKASVLQRVKWYLASPAFTTSWIKIAQALGLPVGTRLTNGHDPEYCALNPTAGGCFAGGGSTGGGGATGSWDAICDGNEFTLDFAGNVISRALDLPDPVLYRYGDSIWINGTTKFVTNSGLSTMKLALNIQNAAKIQPLKLAPMYITNSSGSNIGIYLSAPAYYEGTVLKNASTGSMTATVQPQAWAQSQVYGPPPPTNFVCEGGVGFGDYNQHYQLCSVKPNGYDIPTYGVIPTASLAAWSASGQLSSCKLNPEVIRVIADRAMKAACANGAPECALGTPENPTTPGRVEPEDVRTAGKEPTIRETANTTDKDLPDATTPTTPTNPDPTPTPTASPTTGPDWTNPNTAAPNPTTPTASSIIDKAFDWGFPAITINLGSASCPTYTADFYGHTLTLDSHCPFIEQNRAIISAVMLLFFTISAGIIVLRA